MAETVDFSGFLAFNYTKNLRELHQKFAELHQKFAVCPPWCVPVLKPLKITMRHGGGMCLDGLP